MEDKSKSKASLLKSEPQSIDFGSLSPGQGASATLNVYGGPGKVSVRSDQLKVSPLQWQEEESTLEITLLGGSSGELIWDEVALQADNQELRVPVTARWMEYTVETLMSEDIEVTVAHPQEAGRNSREERTFRGKSCSLCGRNFGYNIDSGSWERCTCTWYKMVGNMSSRIVRELRYGAKDLPSYLQELWRIVLGKEKW